MAINKVIYDGNTLIDLTDMTAIASDVASGKTFYGKDGVLTTGTASGGGGGLEYETGTYTPTQDIARPTISFSKTHSTMPIYVAMYDSTGTYDGTNNSNVGFVYNDFWQWNGNKSMYSSSTIQRYVMVHYMYRGTSATSFSSGTQQLQYDSTYTSDASNSMPRYWVQPSGFKPYTVSSSRYWRAGRTYKWIAIWE